MLYFEGGDQVYNAVNDSHGFESPEKLSSQLERRAQDPDLTCSFGY